ncbi:MAG: hypothetical protein QNJ94_13975 [Alphaproteobacteria bacterium]|nr:hypothetical protein [Alphaproteobacteria bacterium]
MMLFAACSEDGADVDAVLDDPGRLRGQSPEQIQAMFGAPGFKRREGPARIWQYTGPTCNLDLFFYPAKDAPDGPIAVVHFEIRDVTAQPVTSRGCLATLANAQSAAR